MSPKDTVKKNTRYSPQYVPASKPKSKTFVIIAITVVALVALGAFLFFNNQFVGKAIGAQCIEDADCGLGEICDSSGRCAQGSQFSCLNAPQNALLCPGEGTGLTQDTQSILVVTCGQYGPTEKCGFTCNDGYQVQAGICVANVCGDWLVNQANEQCDDGNVVNGDGCSATCQNEVQPACNDNIKNGQETDVDCGGLGCLKCADTSLCLTNADCQSNNCDNGVCVAVAATCFDNTKNGQETDVDCGGLECQKCVDTNLCLTNADCQSNNCDNGVCKSIVQQGSPQDQVLCQQVIDAPAKDKELVSGVLDALGNQNKLDAILDIFTALNNWLKS